MAKEVFVFTLICLAFQAMQMDEVISKTFKGTPVLMRLILNMSLIYNGT